MGQEGNPIWHKIRNYNCQHAHVKLMQSLESVPEGNGTMMDNTLIVYTSGNADKQHTSASTWPFILLGNCGGQIKTGNFLSSLTMEHVPSTHFTQQFCTLIGAPCDRYNMDEASARSLDSE